ncbi:MAG: 2Fe-2S iron-sulfur cluster binding domain-containing protein [Methylobacteriaceae bacterium]|nr:2Fe-2S iron-sulfur cluster binding domain-containing protein [Methylobacteriaceae bacterium]
MTAKEADWRPYRVIDRKVESETIVSLDLAPADGSPPPPFRPGQYLTFRFADRAGAPTQRTYSISSDPADGTRRRISVKREPGGVGSGHMHDRMPPGATIETLAPKGAFTLDETSNRPVILLAGGIGVTPLLAMAHALARTARRATLIHACQNGAVQPFARELGALARECASLRYAVCLAEPTAADLAARAFDFQGFVTREILQALLPIDDYEVYLCGPTPFMRAMFTLLTLLGVAEPRIAYEFFGAGQSLRAADVSAAPATPRTGAAPQADGDMVVFARSGLSVPWDGRHRSLLELAEAHGLTPAFSCRAGVCSTCLCEIEGRVRYFEEPLDIPPAGQALICCSTPDGPVTLQI